MPVFFLTTIVVAFVYFRILQRRLALLEGRLAAVERSVGFLGARDATP